MFKLLILKKIEIKENVIYLRNNINIFIEIANDFFDYYQKYEILRLIQNNQNIDKIDKLNFEKPEDKENLKIVSVILNMYKNNKIQKEKANFNNYFNLINKENYIEKLILEYLDIKDPNYYQIKSFIRILSLEFKQFNESLAFNPVLLKENFIVMKKTEEEALNIRKLLIQNLIKVTKHFTSGPFEELIKTQKDTKKKLIKENNNMDNNIIVILENKIKGITYKNIKPSLILFNLDRFSISILTTLSKNDQEFKNLETLYKSQSLNSELKNLNSFNNNDVLSVLSKFLDNNNNHLDKEIIKNIAGNYVFTVDNLIKIILILKRIEAKVPVIMMGETGCGKTRLIEMAFKLINKDEKASIKKLNIHAGTNDQDIIDFIEKIKKEVEEEDNKLKSEIIPNRKNSKNKKEIEKIKNVIEKRKIWIFFDEINTCNSMGLLSEILCKNSYRGITIDKDERFIFIAACNPYRLLTHKRKMDEILLHKKENKNMLVYSVNPLPDNLLNFVLYFGELREEDEKKYIESMVETTIKLYKNEKNKEELNKIKEECVECVNISQNFLKKENDVSIVSLREVNRFLELFKFFFKFLKERNEYFKNIKIKTEYDKNIISFYKNEKDIFYYKAAVNLSLFLCYYLRLPDKKTRKKLEELLNNKNYFKESFLKIPNLEMDYIINNLIIPKGIAKNRALKENLFSSLFCILNKIPIIICGKPGRSKTLSIQILQNSMKGKLCSKTYLCEIFPELIIYKIQGSLNTRTEDVLNIFKEARNEQKKENENNKLHLILMDEMGLAELSPNNPLKVTHFELEKEGEDKIAFIGISNWALDASKMNRVIYIVVQDPDEDDLILTTKEIVKSYDNNNEIYYDKYNLYFNNLTKAYYKYIININKNNDENKYFHGSRDFYSLIKNVISDIIKNENEINDLKDENEKERDLLLNICIKNIEKNFGGLENSSLELKSNFIELFYNMRNFQIYNEYKLLDYLKENLYDINSRYLLLISDFSISEVIIKYMIKEINNKIIKEDNIRKKEVKILYGSKFKEDEKNINYCDDILYKIKCQMETENIIILKDLEIVYPSLYELFNQSFTYFFNAKFARLGKSKSLSLVNDNFKVIVLVDKENIKKEDPPFINRFEKHIVSFSNILNNDLNDIVQEIDLIINDIYKYISEINNYQKQLNKSGKINLLNTNIKFINKEEIEGLVYIASKEGLNEKDEIIKFVFKKIVPTFTEDIMFILNKFGFKAKYNKYYDDILEIYQSNKKYNIKKYIEDCKNNISIIYTFSPVDDLKKEKIYNNNFNIIIKKITIEEISVSDINTVKQLEKYIIKFIDSKKNLCVFKFRENDLFKLSNIYNIINEYSKRNNDKIYIILIHLTRVIEVNIKDNENKTEISNNTNKYFISFLSETPQYFIDNINNNNNSDNLDEIFSKSSEEAISHIIKDKQLLNRNIDNSLALINYNIYNKGERYQEKIINEIYKDKDLQEILIKIIIILMKENEDIFFKIYKNHKIKIECCSFVEEFYKLLEDEIETEKYLLKAIYYLDKEQILVTYIYNKKFYETNFMKENLNNYIDNINSFVDDKIKFDKININHKIKIKIISGTKFPFVQNIIENNIFKFIKEEISNDNKKGENIKSDELISKLENEILNYQKIVEISNKKEERLNLFQNYLNDNIDKELIKDLLDDCFRVFLMKSNIFVNNYDSLIKLLNELIYLKFKSKLSADINSFFENLNLSESFLDIFKKISNEYPYERIIAEILIFLESYSKEIYSILDIYQFLNTITNEDNIEEINLEIIKIVEKLKLIYDKEEQGKNQQNLNTICFYFIIEAILIKIKKYLEQKGFEEINSLYKKLYYHIMNLFKINESLFLSSKELFTFELLINIFYYYEKQLQIKKEELNKDKYESVIKLIFKGDQLFSEQNENINDIDKNINELDKNLKEINEHSKIIFEGYGNEYSEFIISLIMNRFYLIDYNKHRENVINFLILDEPDQQNPMNKNSSLKENLLEKSYPLISEIFGEIEPKIKEKNLYYSIENKQSKYDYLKKILNKDYFPLNQVIIYFFENNCKNYFNKINNEFEDDGERIQNTFGQNSEKYLEQAIKYINDFNDSNRKMKFPILVKHFCIAYIKCYLNLYIKTLCNDDGNIQNLSSKNDIDKMLFSPKTILTKEIKYFTLKLYGKFKETNTDYEKFIENFKENININEKEEYFDDIISKNNEDYFYSMVPLLNNNYDEKMKELYENLKKEKEIKNLSIQNESTYDVLYACLYLDLCKNILSEQSNRNKSELISLFDFNQESDEGKFINFISENSLKEKILSKIGINNIKDDFSKIEILFYSFRFVFGILCTKNKNNFYYSLLTNEASEKLDKNIIPGHLTNSNNLIKNFNTIKTNFIKDPNIGAYVCSCGYYYTLDGCTVPINEYKCPNCKEIIGGKDGVLNQREGHKRIFFDEEHKNDYYSHHNKKIPFILLSDLEKKVNNQEKELFKGLKKETKSYFLERRTKVREISYITFRVLNFILHGFIFYSNLQNYLSDEYLNNKLVESMTCFEIMEEDWKIINNELKLLKFPNVQVFFNIIYDKILNSMNNVKYFTNDKLLKNFEKEIDDIIQSEIKDKYLINEYYNRNKIIIDMEKPSDKLIILDNDEYYLNSYYEFKDMKYFRIIESSNFENFKQKFESLEENKIYFPIINLILDKDYNDRIKYLQYLPIINKVSNSVIDYCSYNISRDEANSKLKINDIKFDTIEEKDINNFIVAYQELRPLIEQYECHVFENTDFNDLKKENYLSNFCVDIGDINYGMVLSSIYLKMISWQNEFINIVMNSKNISDKNYSGFYENEIMIQDCNKNDIIKFPSINDLIIKYSYYTMSGEVKYNYNYIEKKLASDILPKIKKFVSQNDKCLRYVIYQFEAFRGNKSGIITDFIEKYEPIPIELFEKEKQIIIEEINAQKNKDSLLKILSSLQILINTILETKPKKEELISDILNNQKNENMDKLKDLFNKNVKFTVSHLMNIYNVIEMLCWGIFKENLNDIYKKELNKNIKENIDYYYKECGDSIYITKEKLATALRRFISRYLCSKRSQIDYDENKHIYDYLSKIELWDDYKKIDEQEFENELFSLFPPGEDDYLIKVGHAFYLYEYLGGDEDLKLIESKINKEKDKDNNNNKNKVRKTENIEEHEEPEEEEEEEEDDDINDE